MSLCEWLEKRKREYGTCKSKHARRNKKSGNVQFVLWKAGEQGHNNEWWCDFDSSWWVGFEPYTDN